PPRRVALIIMTRSKLAPLPCAIFTSEQTITWFERRLLGSPTGPVTLPWRRAKQLRRTKMLLRSVEARVRPKPTKKRWRCSTRTASPKTNRLFIVIFPTAPIQELVKQQVAVPVMRNARMFQKWPVTCDPPLYLGSSRCARPLPRGFTGHVAHPVRSIAKASARQDQGTRKEKLESRKYACGRPVSVPQSRDYDLAGTAASAAKRIEQR